MAQPEKTWICNVCGYTHVGVEPPDACPLCGAARDAFEEVVPPVDKAEPALEAARSRPIVVIGGGIAGVSAVESLRKADATVEIVLISEEAVLPYYRLNLTRYLAGEIRAEDLPIHPAAWYEQRRIRLLLGEEVVGVNLSDRTVELREGQRVAFAKLLLASGARPFVPPIPGKERRGVFSLRTIGDADGLLAACRAGTRCVCIGGGLLGLETAGALARRGAQVTLLENCGWLLPRQLNQRAGELLGQHVGRLGVELRNGAVQHIAGGERVEQVILQDGGQIAADVVVIATGVRSNVTLARQAGLEVNRGVVVNDLLATSHPDVLAAGDAAEHQGVVYGLWTASQVQGVVAGTNLGGGSAQFPGLPPATSLKVLGLDLFSIGQGGAEDAACQAIEQEAEGRYVRFTFRDGRMVGAVLLGDTTAMSLAKKAVESGRDFSPILAAAPTAQAVLDALRDGAPPRPSASPRPAAGYRCRVCGYVYEESERGKWHDLPAGWTCPVCGAAKSEFDAVLGEQAAIRPGPRRALAAHRVFGYVFVAIYVLLLLQMLPRLWTYQIELPARTVLHIAVGMAIGAALLLKIAIVRFFRRLERGLVPALGTSILIGSVVLIGISAPSAIQEAAATRQLFSPDSRERVQVLLGQAGLDEAQCSRLASPGSLRAGQRVLRKECIDCHDLRTVLARPRTPESWLQTVRRMADRTTLLNPLEPEEQLQVTAYLVAISPQLQRSVQQLREDSQRRDQARQAAESAGARAAAPVAHDPAAAKRLFESKCAQCHEAHVVQKDPPRSEAKARELVASMVKEGMEASEAELAQLVQYLTQTYAKSTE